MNHAPIYQPPQPTDEEPLMDGSVLGAGFLFVLAIVGVCAAIWAWGPM